MAIARFSKVLLVAYIACLLAGVFVGSVVNAFAKSIYWIEGGAEASVTPEGQPDVAMSDILARR